MEGCAQEAHFLSRRNPDNTPLQGDIVITADFGVCGLSLTYSFLFRTLDDETYHLHILL